MFEPSKVLSLVRDAFPAAEIDPTDHQQVRLERELAGWVQGVQNPERRAALSRQSWNLYKTNGPTYRFVIPFPTGQRIPGHVRRLSMAFWVPHGLPRDLLERLLTLLRSFRMGEPKSFETEDSD